MTTTPALAPATAALADPFAAPLPRTYQRVIALCESLDARLVSAGPEVRPDGGELNGAAPNGTWLDGEALKGTAPKGTWPDGENLARDGEALDAFIGAEAARIRERHGHEPRRDVAASRALHDYLWSVSLLISGAWYLERRVPRLAPGEVGLDCAAGVFEILPGTDFACLPDDPAASAPGARVVAHEEALRAELRSAVADHVGPLLTAIGPRVRRGARALWGMVADDLVSGIWYLGRTLGEEERAVSAAAQLLPAAAPPFPGGAGFRELAGSGGRRYRTRTRLGCCMYYTLDAAEACLTCPRTCDAERVRRLESEC
ncbi:(2Fe-2S)-binding protein [Streptomyces iconiensis]|uniref:(2Fe-2S)-binding protein n=1 Tax=Streptomyces iconiensis TaxID=1384038 RepID=A0ABT6ZST1_9ACTN|nr:(2Fe-2S)-binding protein [Streptomyces iconiensis]MDJ1132127.1 (2Fe-2S)-binding protein [Streptomyces iconiensis]